VAIHNSRLLEIDDENVTFSYKDYRDGGRRKVTSLPGVEFLRRFLTHVLPRGLRHIRHYGFLSQNQRTKKMALIRRLLGLAEPEPAEEVEENDVDSFDGDEDEEKLGRICKECGKGRMIAGPEIPRPTIAEIMEMPHAWELDRVTLPATARAPPTPFQRWLPLQLMRLPWWE